MRPEIEEIECKSLITSLEVRDYEARWTANPYLGCRHAADGRPPSRGQQLPGYQGGRSFERHLVVKANAPAVFRAELARPGWGHESVLLGAGCEPYPGAEPRYRLARGLLEGALAFGNPVIIMTRSPAVLNDLELLRGLSRRRLIRVNLCLATLREETWRLVEPGVAPPQQRLSVMRRLASAGVPTGLLLMPLVPDLTDGEDNLSEVVQTAKAAGAHYLAPNVRELKPGSKAWFLPCLRAAYPHLGLQYVRLYRGPYTPQRYTQEVLDQIAELAQRWGLKPLGIKARRPAGQLSFGF